MTNTQERKKQLRLEMKAKRANLDPQTRLRHSKIIAQKILELEIWQKARCVALYLALPTEIDTKLLLNQAWAQNKTVLVPKVQKDNNLLFLPLTKTTQLKTSRFGILEPTATELQSPRPCPELFLLPALAFDLEGTRLGFGGGCFDRYFAQKRTGLRLGLCFAFQLLPKLPKENFDLAVHAIVTEEEILWLKA